MASTDDAAEVAIPAIGERLPRVLFVSVNPFSSTSNNGKTFASFFEGYPTESVAQLYFHRELPSSTVCQNYFRITDEHLLKDLARPWRVTGEKVSNVSTSSSPIPEKTHAALKGSRTAHLVRQLVWTQVRLDNSKLLAWLEEFDPEIVFFCGGGAAALYPKVSALADQHRAKLALYITDDYVLPIASSNASARAMRLWTRRVFEHLAARADLVLTIGELMSERYKEEFGFDSFPVMNMVDVPEVQPEAHPTAACPEEPLTLVYAGSLHSNRWQVLEKVVESISRLAERGVAARLRVFGPMPTPEMLAAIHRPPLARYGGLLSPDELGRAIADADVLVHVEADDAESVAVTALSVSTKIPEYLASGRSILAVGPRGLASIEYLYAHGVATVLEPHDTTGLDDAIESLALQPEIRAELARRGFVLALANHKGARIRCMLWDRLKSMVG